MQVYLWTSCSFVENAVARKESLAFSDNLYKTLNSYVLNQTAKFGRVIYP